MHLYEVKDITSVARPERVKRLLESYFGALDDATADEITSHCTAVDIRGGEMLFAQGDTGDALYFLLYGRMHALAPTGDGGMRVLGEIEPGAPVGEMAVINEGVRSATVVATRDSTLLRIDAMKVREWFLRYPRILLKTARLAIARTTRNERRRRRREFVVNIAAMPITPGLDFERFRQELQAGLEALGRTLVLDAALVERLSGFSVDDAGDGRLESYRQLTHWLDQQEFDHDFIVYCGNPDGNGDDAWTRRCIRQADRVLLVAAGEASSAVSDLEAIYADTLKGRVGPGTMLALWHPEETFHPHNTRAWLQTRPWVAEHVHVRRGDARHAARLARLITGNAIGLVLGSGGARGIAHIGVFQALCETGVAIDRIGGTSIGAVVAATIACDLSPSEVIRHTGQAFGSNPGGWRDLAIPPLLAMYKGERLKRLLAAFFSESMGLEDLWINFFCVTSDLTYSREVLHTRGQARRILRAAVALPGVFPPVKLDQSLHIDGAFMNAMPVDIMSNRFGMNRIYAVDLSIERTPRFDFHEVPGPVAFLFDRWLRGKKRKYRIPTLSNALVQSSLIASEARMVDARRQVDVLFRPDVRRFGLMRFTRRGFSQLIQVGHQHAHDLLARIARESGDPGVIRRGRRTRPAAVDIEVD